MEPIRINVLINLGLTKELGAVASALLDRLGAAPAVREAEPAAATAKIEPVRKPEPEQEKAEPEKAEAEDPAGSVRKACTVADIREAMDRTRQRIEGADYKNSTDSEPYKKWHRRLTAWFMETAALYGGEKPSMIPDGPGRQKFISDCDRLEVSGEELTTKTPF